MVPAVPPALRELVDSRSDTVRWLLVYELGGEGSAVETDAAWLGRQGGGIELSHAGIDFVRELRAASSTAGLRARVHVLPSALLAGCESLAAAGATVLVEPGAPSIHAFFDTPPEQGRTAWLVEVASAVRDTAVTGGGTCVWEQLPDWARSACDAFDQPEATLSLMRALKQRFDPGSILNPGRFAVGL